MARTLIPFEREAATMKFSDHASAYQRVLQHLGYSEETIETYGRAYLQYATFLKTTGGMDDLRFFTGDMCHAFQRDMGRRLVHPNTAKKTLTALSSLAKYLMTLRDSRGRRVLTENPTMTFRWPMAQQQETQYVRGKDLGKMVDTELDPRRELYKGIGRDLFIETGIRVGEACRLNVGDFGESEGRYFIAVRNKGRGQQRKAKTKEVPLSKALGDAFRDWLLLRGTKVHPDDPLLINSEGQRWKRGSLGNMITRLARSAGVTSIRVSPHKLRHTANVISRIAGTDSATRSRLFGHSSLRSIERYDHVLPHELHEARADQLDALNRYIGKPDRAVSESEDEKRNRQPTTLNDGAELRGNP